MAIEDLGLTVGDLDSIPCAYFSGMFPQKGSLLRVLSIEIRSAQVYKKVAVYVVRVLLRFAYMKLLAIDTIAKMQHSNFHNCHAAMRLNKPSAARKVMYVKRMRRKQWARLSPKINRACCDYSAVTRSRAVP